LSVQFELSRQAIHRRLAARAERAYNEAQMYLDLRRDDLAEGCELIWAFSHRIGDDLTDELERRAQELASLRRTSHWWRGLE
jgi:hypothetical protein